MSSKFFMKGIVMVGVNCKFTVLLWFVIIGGVVCFGGAAFAEDDSEARIERLESALKQIQGELNQLKAEKVEDAKARETVDKEIIEEVVTQVLEDKGTAGTVPEWLNKFKFSGDFKYRHETIDGTTDGDWNDGVSRNRIRARFGLEYEVNEEMDLNFRFASGLFDPASTNQTLTDSFSTKNFLLDRAYLDWHPIWMNEVNVYAGKMKNPFYTPLKTELVWDGDLNPEGGAIGKVDRIDQDTNLYFTGAGFWVDKDSGGVDTSLWGAQSYFRKELECERYALCGVSYYDYGNIENRGDLSSTWGPVSTFYGNTTKEREGDEVYATDFNIFEVFGEYGFESCGMPMSIGGDWVTNFAADSGENVGWLIGMTFNKASGKGTWQGHYNYRDVEADAVLGAFNDSDFANGVTDSKGSEFGYDYMLAENVMGSLYYFLNERGPDDEDVRKFQADIEIFF
jgi:hypothetical protein